MKYIHSLPAATFALCAFSALAQTNQAHGLCAANEEVVFSCALQGSTKTVSLCASTDAEQKKARFQYLFGRPAKIELKVTPEDSSNGDFSRTHLRFAGNTGGYAYSFMNGGYKYILYSISGSNGLNRQGLAVQRIGKMRAESDRSCKQQSVIEKKSDAVWHSMSEWPVDPDIDAHGLPSMN